MLSYQLCHKAGNPKQACNDMTKKYFENGTYKKIAKCVDQIGNGKKFLTTWLFNLSRNLAARNKEMTFSLNKKECSYFGISKCKKNMKLSNLYSNNNSKTGSTPKNLPASCKSIKSRLVRMQKKREQKILPFFTLPYLFDYQSIWDRL